MNDWYKGNNVGTYHHNRMRACCVPLCPPNQYVLPYFDGGGPNGRNREATVEGRGQLLV